MEGTFYAFQLPTSPAYSGWKVEVNIHCTKIIKGRWGQSCEMLLQSQGKRCPCPSSGSQVVLFLQYHLSPVTPRKPWAVVFLHCTVSVIRVLIHVNLCENYCVQQYFLVYCFLPMWIVPFCFLFFLSFLFFFFFLLVICLSSFKRKNKNKLMCCRPICNLFLSLIL